MGAGDDAGGLSAALRGLPSVEQLAGRLDAPHALAVAAARAAIDARRAELRGGADDDADLAATLWDLERWASAAVDLRRSMAHLRSRIDAGDTGALTDGSALVLAKG